MKRNSAAPAALITIIAFSLSLTACSDSNDDPLFPDPAGFSLVNEGLTIATYENGVYEYNPEGMTPDFEYDGRLMLSTTHEGGTLMPPRYYTTDINIRFHDARGHVIEYPDERLSEDYADINPKGEYRLEWEWIHDIHERHANLELHSDHGSWQFHMRADRPGETGIIFQLYRCEGERELIQTGDMTDPNNPRNSIRHCSVAEQKVFEAGTPLMIYVDDYEGLTDDGRYPHGRDYRIR
ncbi:hypothetical protein QA596_06480 [Balneolales bacterium ANBcel1]|nr:hypothetical protein [Balneolales bacterium ANBcel1]